MSRGPTVWVVEASWEIRGDWGPWHPVAGMGLSRTDGRAKLADWKQRNPDDRFRLARYQRSLPK